MMKRCESCDRIAGSNHEHCAHCGGHLFDYHPFPHYAPPIGPTPVVCQPRKHLTEADVRRIVREELAAAALAPTGETKGNE